MSTHHATAVDLIRSLRTGRPCNVDFVYPITSTLLAAETIHARLPLRVDFAPGLASYAATSGLDEVLAGRDPPIRRSGLAGVTYSPLAKLTRDEDVDSANDTVVACMERHLAGNYRSTVAEISHIIGELHDNVASHANGSGYSALQVYGNQVEFAVVDVGFGLLRNVRRVAPEIATHDQAIFWCFQEGNTTARSPAHGFAQRIPADASGKVFPPSVPTTSSENHHLGEGLYQLHQLVRHLHGSLWVLTGNAEMEITPENPDGLYSHSSLDWQGVAIEVTLPVRSLYLAGPSLGDESIARRFGI